MPETGTRIKEEKWQSGLGNPLGPGWEVQISAEWKKEWPRFGRNSVFEQVMNCGQETGFGDQETQVLPNDRFANNKGWAGEEKGSCESWKISRSSQRSSKPAGWKDKGDSGGGGGIRIGTLSLEGYWGGGVNNNDSEMCTVGPARLSRNMLEV